MTTPSSSNDTRYSSGASLYVFDHDVDGWQRRAAFLRTLPGLTHVAVWLEQLSLDEDELARLQAAVAGLRVVVHSPCLQTSMVSHHDVVRGAAAEVARRAIHIATALSAEVVTVTAGTRPFFVDETVAVAQTRAMLAALREHLTQQGSSARLSLRNQPTPPRSTEAPAGTPGSDVQLLPFPATLDELSACAPRSGDIGITLDVGASAANREAWLSFLRTDVSRVLDLQLHDAQPGAATHLPLGTGTVDAFALARVLRTGDYRGFVSIAVGGRNETQRSWDLWRRACDEALQETTASLPSVR